MKFKLATINSLKPVRGPWLVQGVVVFEGLAKKKKKTLFILDSSTTR